MSTETLLDTRPAASPAVAAVLQPGWRVLRRLVGSWRAAVSIAAGIALWQLFVVVVEPNPVAVVGPGRVFREARALISSGVLWSDLAVSLRQFGMGFTIALLGGVTVGLLLGASPRVAAYFSPWLTILYTVPVIALAPVIIIWIGFGTQAKVVIVAVSAFFPIAVNTRAGVQSVDRGLRDVCRAFRASGIETFRHVLLPGAVPSILAGVRLAVGRGLIGLIFGDLFGSTAGIGHLILTAQQNLQTARVYVGVVVLGALGLTFSAIVTSLERRFAPYLPGNDEGAK